VELTLYWRRDKVFVVTRNAESIRIFFSGNADRCIRVQAHVEAILRGEAVGGKLRPALEVLDAKERADERNGKICCVILVGCVALAFLLLIWNELAF
jgi:hypothetical protein